MDLLMATKFLEVTEIKASQLAFEERVHLNCFHCIRYGVNWTCPPKIPQVDYQKLICEYENLLLVYCKMPLTADKFEVVRRTSTNTLHHALLAAEKLLWESNYPLAISFMGGSCKLCPEGCDELACRHPDKARIPLEGIGVNVVKSAENVGLNIVFPPVDYMFRVGLLGW